jgi:hypothetical protein
MSRRKVDECKTLRDGDFKLTASLAVTSGKKVKLWGFIELDLPLEFGLEVSSIEGVIKIRLSATFKERYVIAASIDSDGSISLSAQAIDVGPLQFMQDLLNINPWQWYDDIADNDPDSPIVQGIGALKKLTYEFLSCESLTLMFMMTGDGEQMLIASATGCNLFLIKLSFTVLVIDWSDVMVMISVELGDFTFASAFKAIDGELETLGMLLDLATAGRCRLTVSKPC